MPRYRRGDGSVYVRGKTYWIAYYVDGEQVCESAHSRDKAEARRFLKARQGQVAEGRYVGAAADRVAFDDLAELILTDYKVNGKKSLPDVEQKIRLHLRPFFGKKKAHTITTADIKAYTLKRLEEGAANGKINRELAALKRMFNLALQAEKITRKPHMPMLAENNVRKGFFEQWQFEAVLAKLADCLKPPITVAYITGWRLQTEVLPVRWDQVDLGAETVRLEVGTTKNKDGRLVYLTREMRAVLEAQWNEHITLYPDCDLVFHKQGMPIVNYYKRWHRACREAGISGKIPHDFRRTAVRNMVRAGIPERVAMEITGHKTRAVFDRYHIVSEGDLQEAARKLDKMFQPQTTTVSTTTHQLSEDQVHLSA